MYDIGFYCHYDAFYADNCQFNILCIAKVCRKQFFVVVCKHPSVSFHNSISL